MWKSEVKVGVLLANPKRNAVLRTLRSYSILHPCRNLVKRRYCVSPDSGLGALGVLPEFRRERFLEGCIECLFTSHLVFFDRHGDPTPSCACEVVRLIREERNAWGISV